MKTKTKTGIVIGLRYIPPKQVVDIGTESERLQRALLARQRRWLCFEAWLDWFDEAIVPFMWMAAMAAITYGLLKGLR